MHPAIFLDRDGVIIENRADYVRAWDDVAFIPGALSALTGIADSEFAIVIVTNQAGIGRGMVSLDAAQSINERIRDEIVHAGGRIDGLYLCPHTDSDGCDCRKPKPGMLLRAAQELSLDLSRSWMIGDALTDLQAGEAAGAHSLLVLTGRGAEQKAAYGLEGFADLAGALTHIRQRANGDGHHTA
ncbi:MAG TPA: D-glycero-beta-D-manno-heptose 1,7-bisphosphate 7-phosphatase [Anaerolineales bacterium]|nr:D-glycero-beta-D-manno-heptose 1,7-bisphosphate 7-phosphatase [Anaerolineales bacterium]